jgi:hypothetical protein
MSLFPCASESRSCATQHHTTSALFLPRVFFAFFAFYNSQAQGFTRMVTIT